MKKFMMTLGAVLFSMATMPFLFANAAAMDGWYGGLELGMAMSREIAISGQDNDFEGPSNVCDGFLEGDPGHSDCAARGNTWDNTFDGGVGILSGLTLGYRLGSIRIEGEYFHRTAFHDDENTPTLGGASEEKLNELGVGINSSVRLGDLASHNVFLNAYYDIPIGTPIGTKFRPYVGAGAGFSSISIDYAARFSRSADQRLGRAASTTTVAHERLSDQVFGYQLLGGVDYLLNDRITLGLKLRWANFGKVKVDGKAWDRLRSHDSLTGPGGDPIVYSVETDDTQFWGLSLALKYWF